MTGAARAFLDLSVTGRRLAVAGLALVFAWSLAPAAPGAQGPRAPLVQLQAGLAAAPDDAALARLIADCFDLRRTAHAILAGLPGADAQAEARLAAALGRRLQRELRRPPPLPPTMTWIEDRVLGPGDWLVLTRIADPQGDAQVLSWRVRAGEGGARIVDLLRDGVSGMRARRAEFASLVRSSGLEAALVAEETAVLEGAARP